MKYLTRNTVCTLFEIDRPIWGGGTRVVGLNKSRITKHNEIVFNYVRKSDGKKSLPDHYYFDGDRVANEELPEQVVRGGIRLVLVPLASLEILTREKPVEWVDDPKKMPRLIREVFFEDNQRRMF